MCNVVCASVLTLTDYPEWVIGLGAHSQNCDKAELFDLQQCQVPEFGVK